MKSVLQFLILISIMIPAESFGQERQPPSSAAEYEQRYKENQAKDRINGVYIPKNLDDAFAQLDKMIEPRSREKLKSIPEGVAAKKLHFSLGKWMMVNWQFYEGSRLSNYLSSAGVSYPDDKADFMIRAYHRYLNGKPIELKALATEYKERRKAEHEADLKKAKVISEKRLPKKN